MAEEPVASDNNNDSEEAVTEQQFLRAATSFEAIILSQIDIKNKLGDRLNYSIQAGIILLGIIAVSILILLLTLSTQINKISAVVNDMNQDFASVTVQMNRIDTYVGSIEQRVALLENIGQTTRVMSSEMGAVSKDLEVINANLSGIRSHMGVVRGNVGNISTSINHMTGSVQRMGADMHRMGQPARTINKMFPFPFP